MPDKPDNLTNFWEELKRRKVVRVTVVYLAAAYAILESSTIIFPRLRLADWTINLVMILLFIGLIIVIILSWVYDITPEGIKVTDVEDSKLQNKKIINLENKTIANYVIAQKLGEGRLGIIYKATDTALNRIVALTFLSDWICADKVVRARLIEKAQAAAGIIQPGKTTIYSVEKEDDCIFIVMEYHENQSLSYNVPEELESIIIEAIKSKPGDRADDIYAKEDEPGSTDHKFKSDDDIYDHHSRNYDETFSKPVLVRKRISLPQVILSKKMIMPIIIITIALILIFNWSNIANMLGVSSKRVLAENHLLTGEAYFEDKNFEAAKAEFELAIVIDPDYSAGWSNLAAACINLGELNDAIMHTIKAVELNEKNWMAAYNLAYALDDKEDYIQAIEWYTKAIEWNSTELLAYSALGRVYNLSKRPVEAILILKKANNYFPDSDSLYLIHKNLGYSYYLLGQIKESITFLKSSLESNPDEVETILYMAQSYEAASDITMCIESWQKYISLETDTLKVNNAKEHLQVITKQYLEKIIND